MLKNQDNTGIQVKCLQEGDIEAFLALRDSLPEDKQEFVKSRTPESLKIHLGVPMPMLGVFKDGQLVAGALLTYPEHAESAFFLDQYPLNETTAVLQAVVATEKGVMRHLYEAAADLAMAQGYTSLLAKVRADNECMIASVGRNGYELGEVCDDPLGTAPCGVHFARAAIGFELELATGFRHGPDPLAYQPQTAGHRAVDQLEHTGS